MMCTGEIEQLCVHPNKWEIEEVRNESLRLLCAYVYARVCYWPQSVTFVHHEIK